MAFAAADLGAPGEVRERIEALVEIREVPDRRRGEMRQVPGGHIGASLVGPAVRRAEMAVGQPEPGAFAIHPLGEGFFGARHAFGQHDACVVAGQRDDTLQQILDADILARGEEHGRTLRMPFAPRLRADGEGLIELQFALLDHVEHDIDRHHLRHGGRRHPAIGVLGEQYRARRQVFEIGDRRGRREIGRGGDAGLGHHDRDDGGGEQFLHREIRTLEFTQWVRMTRASP